MTREELLEKIDERIRMNNRKIIKTDNVPDKCAFENNSDLLRLIKSVLENAEDSDKTYDQGLRDIWGLFQKIYDENGYKLNKVYQIFGYEYIDEILERLSPGEALFRMREYEERKRAEEEKPVIGDVVLHINTKDKFVVTSIENGFITGVDSDFIAHTYCYPNEYIKKTGKHADL